jgi:quinol monooxygenase YgiN
MQDVGESWLMISLTKSPVLVALVETAGSLPIFLLALPDGFRHAMRDLQRTRRRDGAVRWGLFRDPAEPGRFIESFVVESWAEHIRQHARATESDKEIEERVREFHIGGGQPTVTHLINERVPR